jgi:hypothetical protein
MTETASTTLPEEAALRDALRKLWSASVVILGFAIGVALTRLLYWPPDTGVDDKPLPSGMAAVLGIAMLVYCAYMFWLYLVAPVVTLRRLVPGPAALARMASVMVRTVLPCGAVIGVPSFAAIAFEPSFPWSVLPLLAIIGVYQAIKTWRGPTVSATVAAMSAPARQDPGHM